jgi:sulfite dehydrogenase (quinone) subunit SoeC
MKPALSVIFFTVLSGAGLGLACWWVLSALLCRSCGVGTNWALLVWIFVLVTIGLISSTQHLANPKNAWRAFSRFKTSWLSREGVLALLFYPLLFAFVASILWFAPQIVLWFSGIALLVCALAVLYCTGMIYACLKTIPQWHTWRTPAKYVLYGLLSGLLLFIAIAARGDVLSDGWLRLALALIVVSFLFWSSTPSDVPTPQLTLNDALGFKEGRVRLLDVGHTHGTFLTNEFGFRVARERTAKLTVVSAVLMFAVPFVILAIESSTASHGVLGLAALSCIVGLLVERWLFFANARHVVMRYHGQ